MYCLLDVLKKIDEEMDKKYLCAECGEKMDCDIFRKNARKICKKCWQKKYNKARREKNKLEK